MEVPCVLNIAAVKLRFKEYDEAIYECNKVLGLEVSVLFLLLAQHGPSCRKSWTMPRTG